MCSSPLAPCSPPASTPWPAADHRSSAKGHHLPSRSSVQELSLRILLLSPISLRSADGVRACRRMMGAHRSAPRVHSPLPFAASLPSSSSHQAARHCPSPHAGRQLPGPSTSFPPPRTAFEMAVKQITLCRNFPRLPCNSLACIYQHYTFRRKEETEGEGQST